MAWSKLDEDRAAEGESWSAFLLKGLTDNVNAYADELAPGFAAAWSYQHPPKWASLADFTGTMVVFNCGLRATEVQLTGLMDHHPTLEGYVRVLHPSTGTYSDATIAGGDATFTVTVSFATPISGPQEFQVLYRSSVAGESLGHFHCFTAIGNQIAVRNGTLNVAANAGRQFWALVLTSSNVDDGQPIAPGGFHQYQIGRVNPLANAGGGQHADGYLITWPDVETNPPILRSTSTFVNQAPNYVEGAIFELSWISLLGVGFKVTANAASEVPMVYAHDLAQSVAGLSRCQRLFAGNSLIQVAASASKDEGFLGCIVGPEAPLLKFYAADVDGTVNLTLRFRALLYQPTFTPPTCTISVVEVLPGPVEIPLLSFDLGIPAIPLMRPRSSFEQRGFCTLAINGVNFGADEWGMADASFGMDLMTSPIIEQTLRFPVQRVGATSAIYAIQVDFTSAVYVASLYIGGA
jgi:hypothetical protein